MTDPTRTGRSTPDRGLGWASPQPATPQPPNPFDVSAARRDPGVTQRLEMIRRLSHPLPDPQAKDTSTGDRGDGDRPDEDLDRRRAGRRDERDVLVRIEWTESTRYAADLYLDPNATDADLYTQLSTIPPEARRTFEIADADTAITSIVDLDGDGHPSVLERAISAGNTITAADAEVDPQPVDWGDLADTIDTRLAEGPDWPALAATLDRAAAGGYDVTDRLPALAAAGPLPARSPAQELQYRVLADTDAALPPPADGDDGDAGQGTRADPPALVSAAPLDRAPAR